MDKNKALLLTGSNDHTARIWELSTNECLAVLRGHAGYIIAVEFEEQSDIYAITASSDKTIKRWGPLPLVENDNGESEHTTIWPHKQNSKIQCIRVLGSIVFSASYNSTIVAIDLTNGHQLRQFNGHRHCIMCLSVTLGRFATSSEYVNNDIDNLNDNLLITGSADWTAKIWDIRSKNAQQNAPPDASSNHASNCLYTLKGHSGTVMTMCVDREEMHVFTGSKDSTIRKWNIKSGHCLVIYEGHEKSITKILLDYESSINGAFLYSSSMDGTLKSWTTIHGTNLRTFRCEEVTITSFIKFRDLLVVFCNNGTLKIFYKDGRKLDEKKLNFKESQNSKHPCIIREVHAAQNRTATTATSKFSLYGGGSDGAVKVFDMNHWWDKVKPYDENGQDVSMVSRNNNKSSNDGRGGERDRDLGHGQRSRATRDRDRPRHNTHDFEVFSPSKNSNYSSLGSMPWSGASKSFGKSLSNQGSHFSQMTHDSYNPSSIFSYSSGPSFASASAFSPNNGGSKPSSGGVNSNRAIRVKPRLTNLAVPNWGLGNLKIIFAKILQRSCRSLKK